MSEFSDIPHDISASDLPAGETILWRGKPDWRCLTLDAFHAPLISLYFLAIGGWHLVAALHDGATGSTALVEASGVLLPALVGLSLVSFLSWLSARATVFTLTDRRLVMRYGIALPALINIPLGQIDAMRMRTGWGGTGDIALSLPRKKGRLAFHQLWPYARPWRLFPADPMLRAVPNPTEVGAILAAALKAANASVEQRAPSPVERPATTPGKAEPALEPVAYPDQVGARSAGTAAAAA